MKNKKKDQINLKPTLYLLLGIFIGLLWFTDKIEIVSLKMLVSAFTIILFGFFMDTFSVYGEE